MDGMRGKAGFLLAGMAVSLAVGFPVGLSRAAAARHEFVADSTFYYRTDRQALVSAGTDFNDPVRLGRMPLSFGEWKGVELPLLHRPVVKPDFMFERNYRDAGGNVVWLQVIRGRIERAVHVPAICYYNAGWKIVQQQTDGIPIDGQLLPCGKMALEKDGLQATELYFYLWKDPGRDFLKGCVMFRVAAFGKEGEHRQRTLLLKRFVRDLFQ